MRLLYVACLLLVTLCYYTNRITASLVSSEVSTDRPSSSLLDTFDVINEAVNEAELSTTQMLSEEEHQHHVNMKKSLLQMNKPKPKGKKSSSKTKKPNAVTNLLKNLKAKKEAKKKKKAAKKLLEKNGPGRGGKPLKNKHALTDETFAEYKSLDKYSEDVAYQLKRFSDVAYCPYESVKTWDCDVCKKESQVGFQVVGQPFGEKSKLSAYVGVAPIGDEKKAIVIAFRGTKMDSAKNWAVNLDFKKKPALPLGAKGKVHRGFMGGYHQMEAGILNALKIARSSCKRCKVYITGHSLGGALATIAAAKLVGKGHVSSKRVIMYNFGSPRIGDETFVRWFSKNVPNTWRITHGHDIVPTVPPAGFGFKHISREVYYPHVKKDFLICNTGSAHEDKECHRRNSKLKNIIKGAKHLINDHMIYVGHPVRCDKTHGKSFLEMTRVEQTMSENETKEMEQAALILYRALGGTIQD